MIIEHNLNNYQLVENYRDDPILRNNFFEFVKKIFPGLSFNEWYKSGYWTDKYIPYSLVANNQIVSNVSISKMNICIEGKFVRGIQFGTVGTLPKFSKLGLSKYLMDFVLEKYKDSTELFFLFANDSVLEFYPKFGFERLTEVVYQLNSNIPKPNFDARKLDINNNSDFTLIQELISKRLILTKNFGSTDYDFITMWHIINVYSKNLYYLAKEQIIFIYTLNNTRLHIWDIIFTNSFDILLVLPKIISSENIDSIYFHFPPDLVKFNYDKIMEDQESLFFVKGNFPIRGKPFKFPVTAQT